MNRRDFLKFSSLALAGCVPVPVPATVTPKPGFDIVEAFASVQDGGVIDIQPGEYVVSNTLSLRNRRDVTVNANHARIYSNMPTDGIVKLDMAGANRCSLFGLRLYSHPNPHIPLAELVLGRTEQSDGGGNTFFDCSFAGNYSGAGVINVCQEGNRFIASEFQTETNKSAIALSKRDTFGLGLVESSNVLHYYDKCSFRNYGTAPHLISVNGFISGLTVRDGYGALGPGAFLDLFAEGDELVYYLSISDFRTEGTSRDCLLINNHGHYSAAWDISRIMWQIESDYIIHSSESILDSRLDFTFAGWSYADKWLHMTNNAALVRTDLIGNWDGKIVSE